MSYLITLNQTAVYMNQQSVLNKCWHALTFGTMGHNFPSQLEMLATSIFCRILQTSSMQQREICVMNSKLLLTYGSFSSNPPLLLHNWIRPSLSVTWCVFRWLWGANNFLHTTQLYSCSPLCMRRCLLRLPRKLKDFLNTSQQNSHSPLCMRWCFFSSHSWLNDLLHTSQQNGRTPLCVCWCLFRLLWLLKDFLHTSQQNGRSPLCMRWWVFRFPWYLNDLLHTSQQNGRSPLCMRWWVFKLSSRLNDLLHSSQEYRCSSPHTGWSSFRVLCKMRWNYMRNHAMKINKSETHVQRELKRLGAKG
jgi:hypothetical protein